MMDFVFVQDLLGLKLYGYKEGSRAWVISEDSRTGTWQASHKPDGYNSTTEWLGFSYPSREEAVKACEEHRKKTTQ